MRSSTERHLTLLQAAPEPAGEFALEGAGRDAPGLKAAPEELRQRVIQVLRTVRDPELPVNVYDLGLIYALEVDAMGKVELAMTLTAPACPVAGQVVSEVHEQVRALPGVAHVRTRLVWDPPWTPDRLSTAAKLELGLM